MRNLSSGGANPSQWAKVAASNLEHLSRSESKKILVEASQGAGLAIVLGNILDTIPACLVIGAKFVGVETLSITLIVGMFVSGTPEAAASASTLKKPGYNTGNRETPERTQGGGSVRANYKLRNPHSERHPQAFQPLVDHRGPSKTYER
jgi:hypothetical protein